jgi:2-C-methyl-D-erythritol 4-phosphate cytidylyltransferase/2-C-methyl-D-erythritol 2,4-cyclodiphosphate synthase
VVIPQGAQEIAAACLAGLDGMRFVTGGASRQESVRNGLEALAADAPALVLIHDAARPILPRGVIDRLVAALAQQPGAIPVLPVVDSLCRADGSVMGAPPAARRCAGCRPTRRSAMMPFWPRTARGRPRRPPDDAQVAQAHGLAIALVEETKPAQTHLVERFRAPPPPFPHRFRL